MKNTHAFAHITPAGIKFWQNTMYEKISDWVKDLNANDSLYEAAVYYCIEQNPYADGNWLEYFTNVYRILCCMHHNDPVVTRLMVAVGSGIHIFYGEIFHRQACNPAILEVFEDKARLLAMRRMFATA